MFSFCNTISFFSGYTDSLYCNEAMEYDEDIQEHINEINSFKPQVNKFITCLLAHALIRMVIYSFTFFTKILTMKIGPANISDLTEMTIIRFVNKVWQ